MEDPDRLATHPRPGLETTRPRPDPSSPKADRWIEAESAGFEQAPLDVVGEVAEAEGGAAEVLEAAVGRVDQRSATADDAEALLARGVLPVGVTLDGFLFDDAGHLVDTFEEVLDAGRAMSVVVHAWHHVGLDLPLATRAVVTVRERA